MRNQFFNQPSFIPIFNTYSNFEGKMIGITGQEGVLGNLLYTRLIERNMKVEFFPGDINDVATLNKWFNNHHFDYFFHLAAVVPTLEVDNNPINAFETNVIGTFNICKLIIESQPKCWLFLASTSHIYDPYFAFQAKPLRFGDQENPGSFYGATKLASEQISRPILEHFSIAYCIGRIFSFTGNQQKEPYLVPTLRRKIKELQNGDILKITNPDSVRDMMDAETVIDCILHLAQNRFPGTINIGTGKGIKIREIADKIAKELSKEIQIIGVNKDKPNSLIADISDLEKQLSNPLKF